MLLNEKVIDNSLQIEKRTFHVIFLKTYHNKTISIFCHIDADKLRNNVSIFLDSMRQW